MGELAQQLIAVSGVLLACFAGPAVAIFLLQARKRRARARRRSPIGIDLLRGPGHTVREQLEEAMTDVQFDVTMLMVLPLLILSLFFVQSYVRGLEGMIHLAAIYALGALVYVTYMIGRLLKAGTHVDNLKAGYDAELAVGQQLDQLMRQGAVVFHDVPGDAFNIDHVVVAAEGVFAVETKGYTKPIQGLGKADATVVYDGRTLKFPTWTSKDALEQAQRQASWLAKWLGSATGDPVSVMAVLALPGWFVERSGRGDVRVYSGKELEGLLNARGTQPLSPQDLRRIAHQLEQRCRTVAPTYGEMTRARCE